MFRRGLIILLLIGTGAAAYWYLSRPRPLPVALHVVERGTVESRVANTRAGTIKACRRSGLAPAVGGQVHRLNVKEGDRVKKGQTLLEIWNDDLRAEIELAINEATSSRARAEEACVLADVAESQSARQVKLFERALISQEQMERAVADAKAARAKCQAARAEVDVKESRVTVTKAALERTRLKAPFNGVVAEINAEPGEFVTPSPTGIATPPAIDLIDDTCLIVSAPIDEVDAPVIREGMKAWVSLDAFPGRRWPGTVRRVAPYVLEKEKQARTVEIEVELQDPKEPDLLLAGYSADVEVILAVRERALRVPTEAVLEGHRVLVYGQNGRLIERAFKPGLSNWEFMEVLSGLETGERVVLSVGREGIKAGGYVVPENSVPRNRR